MHRRRIVAPNDRPNRNTRQRHEERLQSAQMWWRVFMAPVYVVVITIALVLWTQQHIGAGHKVKISSRGHQTGRPTPRTLTATIRQTQHSYGHTLPSLQPVESIWPAKRPPHAVKKAASPNQIETLLESYAFTMSTRAYWQLEDILASNVTWYVKDHRKNSTPHKIQGLGEVRKELEALYRPYITGHRQETPRIELLQHDRALAVTEFEISVVESSTPEDGYKGRSAFGTYVDELIWTNTTQWQIRVRNVEYTGECRCDPAIAPCSPGCPVLLMGPAMLYGAPDRIPLESIYLAYAEEEGLPAAGPIPQSWNAASRNTTGNVGLLTSTLRRAGFGTDIAHAYQAHAYRTDSTGALVVYLRIHSPGKLLGSESGPPAMSASTLLFLTPANESDHPYRNPISLGMEFSRDHESVYAYVNGPGVEKIDRKKILSLEDILGTVGAMAGQWNCTTCF